MIGLFEANNLHPSHVVLYGAAAKLMKGNPGGCIKSLTALSTMRISRPDVAARLRAVALQLTAEALERLQDYRKAYNAYREMNAVDLAPPIDLGEFRTITLRAAEMEVPPLPADPHDNYFVMTGFPRSGTTLLENALAAHPLIETFEEIQADSAMHVYLDRMRPPLRAGAEKATDLPRGAPALLRGNGPPAAQGRGDDVRRQDADALGRRGVQRQAVSRPSATSFRSAIPSTWC